MSVVIKALLRQERMDIYFPAAEPVKRKKEKKKESLCLSAEPMLVLCVVDYRDSFLRNG